MNITFLIILIGWFGLTYFLKNTFKFNTKGYRKYIWLLNVVILLMGLELVIRHYDALSVQPHFLFLGLTLNFLIPPLLYFAIRERHKRPKKLRPRDYGHFLPALIALIVIWPIYALDSGPKVDLLDAAPFTVDLLTWAFIAQFAIYLIHMTGVHGRSKQKQDWLMLAVASLLWSGHIIVILAYDNQSLLIMGYLVLMLASFWYLGLKPDKAKSQSSNTYNHVVVAIEEAMKKDKLYLEPDLTLSMLATKLDVSTNKVSAALNNVLSVNYNDYLNRYRVNEVIRHLENRMDSKYTLEAISKMSGFRSLTTFNTAFKKQTGKTPKTYKV